jgi:hypothetical protein
MVSAESAVEAHESRRVGRSIWAVLAGLLTIAIVDNAIDVVMHTTGIYPPVGLAMADPLFLLAIAYRTVDGILGCYIAAALAPRNPMRHALILGGIGVVLSSLGVVATWNGGPEFGPAWYPISLVIVTPLVAWIGGRLGERRWRAASYD